MRFAQSAENPQLWRFRWHCLFVLLVVAAMLMAITSAIAGTSVEQNAKVVLALWVVTVVIFMAAIAVGFFALLVLAYENVKSIIDNGEKLNGAVEMINKNRSLLGQISQGVRLSDAAKEIAFRDAEVMELREAVLGKLHQQDFNTTYSMIDAMAQQTKYKQLAEQLRKTADMYQDATEEGRINQIITHIDRLCEQYHWAQASAQISRLIKAYPDSAKAHAMAGKIRQRKDKRKKELLAMWDQAVKRQNTDRSLEILKELDLYLTPNEGLALQESASSVFRTKLHNLGVQFSLAVAEQQWAKAFETGRQIVRDFPNSRMAHEIRGKMEILRDRASA